MNGKTKALDLHSGNEHLDAPIRLPYEAPRLLRKREVKRVTLFSGFGGQGGPGGGLTAAG